MVKRGTELPKKLKQDAIVEAVVEFRFESSTIPEVFLGRVIDSQRWRGWLKKQLPAYNLPPQIRRIDRNVQYAPLFQLSEPGSPAALRIGPKVLSFHQLAPYVGWMVFKPALEAVVETLFSTVDGLQVKRIGLRYMNALRPGIHNIRSVADLDLKLVVSEDLLSEKVNLNFITKVRGDSSCIVRVSTMDFVQGPTQIPADTSVFVDVDVYTNDGFTTSDKTVVNDWVEFAHTQEKTEFFHLFTQNAIDNLREE
jgi:uncharacterized protein (TIGR04255 family)